MCAAQVSAIISPEALAARLAAPATPDALVLIDLRWYLPRPDAPRGQEVYLQGHLPGAVFLDLDRDLSGVPARGPGRHPLPSAAQLEAAMARAGVGAQSDVVVYDDAGGSIAARLWFLLRLFGHQGQVAVLDGGLPRWRAQGRPLETGPSPTPSAPSQPFRADPARLATWIMDRTAVAAASSQPRSLVLDARASERYRGDLEPIDARPGHIPGARSAPWAGNLDPVTGCFLAPSALRERYQAIAAQNAAGVASIIAYCGSGVTACHDLLALHLAGYSDDMLRLYEGSWSDWARDRSLPAATGD